MFSLLYNLFLCGMALCALPRLFTMSREVVWSRLGCRLPCRTSDKPLIWLHAVSMGETKAIAALFQQLRALYPQAEFALSTTTATGLMQAKRLMPEASFHFLLPLDFSWTMRRLARRLRPTLLLLSEGDIWYHLLQAVRASGGHIALVNGKLSARSARRWCLLQSLARRFFAPLELLCVQSELQKERYLSLGILPDRIVVTGNMKLDAPLPEHDAASERALREKLGIAPGDEVLVIGSTHAPEEEQILGQLRPLLAERPHLKILLVPRHPERFEEVARLFAPLSRFSAPGPATTPLVLIDAMGLLTSCYAIATLALVAGSYTPSVGGHNVLEPIPWGVPVLFGPHMQGQLELRDLVLSAGAGLEVPLEALAPTLRRLLAERHSYVEACHALARTLPGATARTLHIIRLRFNQILL